MARHQAHFDTHLSCEAEDCGCLLIVFGKSVLIWGGMCGVLA